MTYDNTPSAGQAQAAAAPSQLGFPISLASAPYAVAANPVTNRIYVTTAANTVTVIDGVTNQVIGTPIRVGGTGADITRIAVDHTTNRVYVADNGANVVHVIDGGAGTVVGGITVGNSPFGVAVDPATHRVYVTNAQDLTVSVIQGSVNGTGGPGTVVGQAIKVGTFQPTLYGLAVNPVTHRVYVALPYVESGIAVIEGSTDGTGGPGTIVGQTIPITGAPDGVAVDLNTDRVYVANSALGTVSVIYGGSTDNGGAGGVVGQPIQVGPRLGQVSNVAVYPYGKRVYVTCGDNDNVTVIDGRTARIVEVLGVGTTPKGVAVNPTSGFIYVANSGATSIAVLGTPFLQEALIGDAITVESNPVSVAVNPGTSRIYVANTDSDSVSVIDGASSGNRGAGSIVGTAIPVGSRPAGVALNPATNRVYVTNRGANSVSVINGGGSGNGGAGSIIGNPISVGKSPSGVAVTTRILPRGVVYVTNQGDNSVTAIDASGVGNGGAGSVLGSAIAVGSSPKGVAVNPGAVRGGRIYVVNNSSNSVTVISGGSGNVVGTPIRVVDQPSDVAVNPAISRVYVTGSDSDDVTVIDSSSRGNGGAGAVIGSSITVGDIPYGLAVNPTTNRVYVTAAVSDTISACDLTLLSADGYGPVGWGVREVNVVSGQAAFLIAG